MAVPSHLWALVCETNCPASSDVHPTEFLFFLIELEFFISNVQEKV